MNIREVIRTLNQAHTDGIIERYAIAGAVGATFYLEPVATLDIDVFITFEAPPGQLIASPKPVLDYLIARGAVLEGEYVVIAETPVQLLPASGSLVEEALEEAVQRDVEESVEPEKTISARVFTAEHLAAIALKTGRGKDKARLLQFIEAGAINAARFQTILKRHELVGRWQEFERQFLSDES